MAEIKGINKNWALALEKKNAKSAPAQCQVGFKAEGIQQQLDSKSIFRKTSSKTNNIVLFYRKNKISVIQYIIIL